MVKRYKTKCVGFEIKTRRKLLCQKDSAHVLQTAIADAIAEGEVKAIHYLANENTRLTLTMVNSVRDKCRGYYRRRVAPGKYLRLPKSQLCLRCNKRDHASHEFRFRDAICHNSKRIVSTARACRNRRTTMSENVEHAERNDRYTPQQTTLFATF